MKVNRSVESGEPQFPVTLTYKIFILKAPFLSAVFDQKFGRVNFCNNNQKLFEPVSGTWEMGKT